MCQICYVLGAGIVKVRTGESKLLLKRAWARVDGRLTPRSACLAVFLVTLAMHLALNPFLVSLSSLPTEFSSLAMGAQLLGYQWDSTIQTFGYYGTGFYTLLTPLLKIPDTYWRHQAFLLVVCALYAACSAICFWMMDRYFKIHSRAFSLIVSVLLSFAAVSRSNVASNEGPLQIILWLCLLLLMQNILYHPGSDGSKRAFLLRSILLAVLLAWSRTIHERAIVLIIAFVLGVVLYHICYRRPVIHYVAFAVPFAVGLALSAWYVWLVKDLVWSNVSTAELVNSLDMVAGSMISNLKFLRTAVGWQAYFTNTITLVFSGNIYSLGAFFVAMLAAFSAAWAGFARRIQRLRGPGRLALAHPDERDESIFFLLAIILAACVGATVLSHGLISLHGTTNRLASGSSVSRSSFLLRYYYVFLTPLFMLVGVAAYRARETVLRMIRYSAVAFVPVCFCTLAFVAAPALAAPSPVMDATLYYSPFTFRSQTESLTPLQFFIVLTVVFFLYGVCYVLLRKQLLKTVAVLLLAVSCYQYTYLSFVKDVSYANSLYSQVDATIALDRAGLLSEDVNYFGKSENDYFSRMVLQYELADSRVSADAPYWRGMAGAVATTNTMPDPQDALTNGYSYGRLDDNEYVMASRQMVDRLTDAGIDMKPVPFGVSWLSLTENDAYTVYGRDSQQRLYPKEVVLATSGACHGPFVWLPPGTYDVTYTGGNMRGATMWAVGADDQMEIPGQYMARKFDYITYRIVVGHLDQRAAFVLLNEDDRLLWIEEITIVPVNVP